MKRWELKVAANSMISVKSFVQSFPSMAKSFNKSFKSFKRACLSEILTIQNSLAFETPF
jgi:hypothetical protein